MKELLCFPIMLSLAEVRNDLTIPVLSAVHLRALHVGLGETEAGEGAFLPPSSSPGAMASSLLPGSSRSRTRLAEQGQAAGSTQTSYWRRRLG